MGWDGKAGDEAVWDRDGMGTRDVLGPWQRKREDGEHDRELNEANLITAAVSGESEKGEEAKRRF